MSDCIFCKIVDGKIPAKKVYEDEDILAFNDIITYAAFDAINAEDPQRIEVAGVPTPRTLVHARSVSQWIERLYPQASEALSLAARAHHLRRWEHPRSQWPMTREGYLRWRLELKRIHAEVAAGVLGALGYEPELISRVGALIRRERLKLDPEAQALEDAICLAFLEHDFDHFGPQHDPANIVHRQVRVVEVTV